MISLGITMDGQKILLNEQGEHVHQKSSPDKIILGVGIDHVISKRIWVDAELNDEQKILFSKSHFEDAKNTYIDYECIKQDQGRELLHVYGVSRSKILNCIQRYQLNETALYSETVLHGLGRALAQRYDLGKKLFHCISFFDHSLVFSIHTQEVLIYYQQEPINGCRDVVCAVRRALVRCQADDDYRDINQLIYAFFTKNRALNNYNIVDLGLSHLCVSYECCQSIIPYGLALRGSM